MTPTQLAQSPLTGTTNVTLLQSVIVDDIVSVFRKAFGISIEDEFLDVRELGLYQCNDSGLRFFWPAVAGTEQFYEKLQAFPWYYLEEKSEYDYARQFVSASDNVLEVGCGAGHFAKLINPKSYIGLELSKKAKARGIASGLNVVNETIEKFAATHLSAFDLVVSFQVLEHVPMPRSFLKACSDALVPGGLLVISVPNADSYITICPNSVLNMPPHHLTWWTEPVFEYAAQQLQLETVAVHKERVSDLHLPALATAIARELLGGLFVKTKRHNLIKKGLLNRITQRVYMTVGKLILPGLRDSRLRPIGHTLTIVFRKPRAN